MRFRVENLGPLRDAEIDLSKNLIIFAGPNNTGKTYLAWAIYGFQRFLRSTNNLIASLEEEGEPKEEESLGSLLALLDQVVANPDTPVSFAEVLDRGDFFHAQAAHYTRQIADEYAGQPEHFVTAKISVTPPGPLRFSPKSFVLTASSDVKFAEQTMVMSHLRNAQPPSSNPGGNEVVDPTRLRHDLLMVLAWALTRSLRHTTIFPVERLAINTFAKELTERRTELVDELSARVAHGQEISGMLRRQVERYPRAIRDALHDASRLDAFRRETSPFSDLADELEASILGGRLALNEDSVLEFTPERAASTRLRIQQSASVVKSLASLVFHLRHRAQADECLIIDEPELNLHPDNQRKVARILAKLVHRGVQIILSTHSDYLIRELNNLIMLAQPSEKARALVEEFGLDAEMLLSPDSLGVYLFHPDGTCQSVPVDHTGFAVQTIDDEVHKLNLDAQTIYSRLFLDE